MTNCKICGHPLEHHGPNGRGIRGEYYAKGTFGHDYISEQGIRYAAKSQIDNRLRWKKLRGGKLSSNTLEERWQRLARYFSLFDYCYDAIGIVVRPMRLFNIGDPLLIWVCNGQGERWPVFGWSTKVNAPIQDYYVQFYRYKD